MPTVIRATDRNAGIHPVAFNFSDIADEANKRLDTFRVEAQAILDAARREAGQIRKQAEIDGRRAAEEIILRELSGRMDTLLPALRRAIEDIHHAKQAWLSHWEKCAVRVAAAIAQRLIRRELPRSPEITLTLVREALELAAGEDHLRLHLNPADHETLGPRVGLLIKELSGLAAPEVLADPAITRGGCRVETRFGAIDQQFEAQLARIEEELT
jgi:flagellar assembly protein FliH